ALRCDNTVTTLATRRAPFGDGRGGRGAPRSGREGIRRRAGELVPQRSVAGASRVEPGCAHDRASAFAPYPGTSRSSAHATVRGLASSRDREGAPGECEVDRALC